MADTVLTARGGRIKMAGTEYPPLCYFPIGYVYISVDSTNPATYFGGTWEPLKKCFLYAGDSSDANVNFRPGKTGGSRTKTLTRANLPNEKIDIKYEPVADKNTTNGNKYLKDRMSTVLYNTYTDATNPKEYIPAVAASSAIVKKDQSHDDVVSWTTPDSVGTANSSVHSILKTDSLNGGVTQEAIDVSPEYLSVYMWKRTA